MKIEKVSRLLPFRCEEVFDLAADVERYPEFVPGWISARILKKDAKVLWVEQTLGIGPARMQFTSRAVLHRPERIEVTSSEAPFRHYSLTWLLAPHSVASCSLAVIVDLELRSSLLHHVVQPLLPGSIERVVAAFEARAQTLCGRGDG